jgi:hypothetical protein
VAIEDVTTIPAGYELVWKPELKQVDSEAATFEGTIEQKDNSLVLTEKMNYNKRIYQPEEWPGYRDAVLMQKKIIENPVILKLKK